VATVQLDFGMIKIDVEKLVRSIHDLVKIELNDEARDSLKSSMR
jgi:hypothetical protein